MSHFLGFVFETEGNETNDLLEKYVGEGVEVDDDGIVWEYKCDWYRGGPDVLRTKNGEAVGSAKVADVDWDLTCEMLDSIPEDNAQLECVVSDEDGWIGEDDFWESSWADYIKRLVARLLEADADAMVFVINFHN